MPGDTAALSGIAMRALSFDIAIFSENDGGMFPDQPSLRWLERVARDLAERRNLRNDNMAGGIRHHAFRPCRAFERKPGRRVATHVRNEGRDPSRLRASDMNAADISVALNDASFRIGRI